MGYTHYWTYKRNGPQSEWANALAHVHQVLQETDVPLEIEYGDHEITINGAQCGLPHATAEARWACNACSERQHETFVLYTVLSELPENPSYASWGASEYWDFCKTARKPYDVPVSGILAILATLAPNCIEVDSDGDLSDWLPGIALAERATGLLLHAPESLREPV